MGCYHYLYYFQLFLTNIVTMKNFLTLIQNISALDPSRIAVSIKDREINYLQFNKLILSFSLRLIKAGVTNESCVAILLKTDLSSLISILAIAHVGASWVQLTAPTIKNYKKLNVTHLLLDAPQKSRLDNVQTVVIDKAWFSLFPVSEIAELDKLIVNIKDDHTWMYAQSSGSTGTQKFMALSYSNYFARTNKASMTHDFFPVITANLFAPLTGPWVSYNLRTLRLGGKLVFVNDPLFWQKINVQKVFGSPKQFDGMLTRFRHLNFRLPIAHIAGASVTRSFSERVFKHFDIIHNFYGGTEVGGVSRNVLAAPPEDVSCVGKIFPENDLEIMDDSGRVLPIGEVGNIAIKNNILVNGYVGDADATSKCFKNGWFFPGDIGYKDDSNRLFLTGRISEVLNISGSKININFLESLVSDSEGVADCAAFVRHFEDKPDQLMLMVTMKQGLDAVMHINKLGKSLLAHPDIAHKVSGIYHVEEIPRNQNGKILRNDLEKSVLGKKYFHLATKQ
jgi:acyl-coenzyme A synthetase/AMP-(fatty) acid ligase